MQYRELNEKQYRALDRIELADPKARVVGWVDQKNMGRGPLVTFSDGSRVLVNVTGHTKKA